MIEICKDKFPIYSKRKELIDKIWQNIYFFEHYDDYDKLHHNIDLFTEIFELDNDSGITDYELKNIEKFQELLEQEKYEELINYKIIE